MIERIAGNFSDVYAGQKPVIVSRASGRVELIGGHTDYNEGFVIAAAIDKSCWVGASKREDNRICFYSELFEEKHEFELSRDLQPSTKCKWANYGIGVAALLLKEGVTLKGANLYIASDVPVGSGLSSSAALEVSLARAMIDIAEPEYKIKPQRLARICQKAENIYANSPCGIMDQTVSIMGEKDHALFLDCRDVSIKSLPFESSNCCIMIFNSMVQHEVGGGEYGKRRTRCEQARDILKKKYPDVKALRDVDDAMLESVKERLEPVTFSRAAHVIGENARVLAAAESLKRNDVAGFGKLMSQSHCSARDLYEISCEETDFLAEQIRGCNGSYGARIMGGGFGGAVVALARPDSTDEISQKVRSAYKEKFGLESDVHIASPSEGAQIIRR